MAHATSRSLQPGQSYALSVADHLSTIYRIFSVQYQESTVCSICCVQPRTWTWTMQSARQRKTTQQLPTWLPVPNCVATQVETVVTGSCAAARDGTAEHQSRPGPGRIEESLPGYRGLGRTAPAESLFFSVPRTTKLQNGRSYPLSRPMPRTRS